MVLLSNFAAIHDITTPDTQNAPFAPGHPKVEKNAILNLPIDASDGYFCSLGNALTPDNRSILIEVRHANNDLSI